MRLYAFFAAVILIISFAARSGVLVEPLVGYQFNGKVDYEDSKNYSGGMGSAFGGRLGYTALGLQLGVDYLMSSIDMDDDDFDKNVDSTEIGVFVGYQFPILVRAYAGYVLSAKAESENGSSVKTEFEDGSGMKVGFGFTGLPFLVINGEVRNISYDNWTLGGVDQNKKVEFSAFLLSVSLPLSF